MINGSLIDFLSSRKLKFKEYYNLSRVSSIKIGGDAALAVWPEHIADFVELIAHLCDRGVRHKVIGGMTNTLFSDGVYDGVVIFTEKLNGVAKNAEYFTAECGASISRLLYFAKTQGYGGAEELWHIPGSIGGAVRGNSGAFGKEIADVFVSGEFLKPDGTVVHICKEDMSFSYRTSRLKLERLYLLRAELCLHRKGENDISHDIRTYRERRRQAQPLDLPSLGSAFKRVYGQSAGYYIDKLGMKGFSVGGAAISEKHAGFIVNKGGATACDVLALIETVQKRVYDELGIRLEAEIEIL